jgi:hypothetical protein
MAGLLSLLAAGDAAGLPSTLAGGRAAGGGADDGLLDRLALPAGLTEVSVLDYEVLGFGSKKREGRGGRGAGRNG